MNQTENNRFMSNIETLAAVLIRCFFISAVFLIIWFAWFILFKDFGYQFHSSWIEFSKSQFDLMNYYGMVTFKLLMFTFFLIPFLGIKLVLKKGCICGCRSEQASEKKQ